MQALDPEQVAAALETLSAWDLEGGKLHRRLRFTDFRAAFGFMTGVALLAESMNHHPEWSNVYNRVEIHLTTHEANGITTRDIDLAREIDRLATNQVVA